MKNIIACIDFSQATSEILDAACTLGTALRSKVSLLHVVALDDRLGSLEGGVAIPEELVSKAMNYARKKLDALREPLLANGLDVATILIEEHWSPAKAILDEARKQDADIIIIGSHGHGMAYRLLVGSTTNAVLNGAKGPVLVVPTRPAEDSKATKTAAKQPAKAKAGTKRK